MFEITAGFREPAVRLRRNRTARGGLPHVSAIIGRAMVRALAVVSSFAEIGAVAVAVVACGGARGGVVEAPVELVVAPIASTADGGGVHASALSGPPPGGGCAVMLTIGGRIEKSSPGCYLDEFISKSPGLLRFPCSGDGSVEVDFGEHHYTGRVSNGEVELAVSTELDWEDGCRWGTRAVISGPLVSKGEPMMRALTWRYRDHVISGTSCSGVCVASASIQVTSPSGKRVERVIIDDDSN